MKESLLVLLCMLGGALVAADVGLNNSYPLNGMTTRKFKCQLPPGCPDNTEYFLTFYHYLNPNPAKECTVGDVKAALRAFQTFNIQYNVSVTGDCDDVTVELFNRSRCGCEDFPLKDKKMPNNFYGPQQFNVGRDKWSKTHLTWKVTAYPVVNNHLRNHEVDDAMRRGLDIWAQQTPLTFQKVSSSSPADIDIRFGRYRHTTSPPYFDFDGKSGVLAHAFFPESGVVHFDDDEDFVLYKNTGTELYIVAAHEFGHTLGISHSNVENALMAPYYRYSENLKLHPDDIQAVQYLYGAGKKPNVVTTPAPPRPPPTTTKLNMPDYCNMKIQAAFNLADTRATYIFTNDPKENYRTIVYKVTSRGIDPNSRKTLPELFQKEEKTTYPRAYPTRVDAAAYIPSKRYIFLFRGTRAYRYTVRSPSGPFYLDKGYPRWMNVTEFPERPRTAVAMPMGYYSYYMQIFGKTMHWDWDFDIQRVGAWAYPIGSFGRNMPTNVNTAFTKDKDTLVFIKGDKYIEFSLRYRRVMDDRAKSVKRDFFKRACA